jgi:hypothetical protein
MEEFKEGNIVIVNGDYGCVEFREDIGTVMYVTTDYLTVRFSDDTYDIPKTMCTIYKSIFEEFAYSALEEVLDDALEQSSSGKGKIRHANNNRYEDQVICVVQRLLKDHPFGGHAYQIIKKTIEAGRLYKIKGKDAAYQEMLGAINYSSAMCILIKEDQ